MNQKLIVFLFTLLLPTFLLAQEDLPKGTELLTNNYFDDGLNNWELYSLDNSRAEYELDTNSVITGKNSVHITVHKPYGGYPSGRIQLNQHNIPGGVVAGNSYYISFNLKANVDIDAGFWTIYKEPNYNVYYDWEWVKYSKSDGVKSFSYTYRSSGTDTSVYFAIDLASFKKDNVELWIDDIHFIALPDPIIEPPLPLGGIELLNNNYFNVGINNWELNVNKSDDASYNLDSDDILEGKYSGHVRVNNTFDSGSQQTQFYQKDLLDSVKAGSEYHIQFIAKANKSVSNLFWSVNQQNAPSETLHSAEFSLPENEIVFVIDTILFATDEMVSWSFDLGIISKDSVDIWFDAVHLIEIKELGENGFPPETTWENTRAITIPKPGYLQSVREPKYGVDYTRISDPIVFGVPNGSSALIHGYAKKQSWNCDMTKIELGSNRILNADNYTLEKVLPHLSESRWSSVDSKIIYFCSGDEFKKINIETEQVTNLHSFPGYNVTIGPWEGNIDANDKYVAITKESGGVGIEASIYDIELDTVIAVRSFPGNGADWVSMTPSGNYIVAANIQTHRVEVYDLDFNFLRNVGSSTQHGDFGVDVDGNEVWVQVIPLSMHRLSDGKSTRLVAPNVAGHISGRGFQNPGWALVSTAINAGLNETEMFSVKLDGSGTIRHYGHARTSCTTYDNYPFGSVSPDGKKVIYNSDWDLYGSGGTPLAYIAEYRIATDVDELGDNSTNELGFTLSHNYPNPFNPTTTINYTLKVDGMTKLIVYNTLGQEVKVLLNENMQAGSYSTPFNGNNLSSGIYFYKLESNNQMQVKKMVLLK